MKKSVLIFAALLTLANLTFFGQSGFELLNPRPSYESGIDIQFVSANTGFIINEDQLIETTDAGASWQVRQNITGANDIDFYNSTGFIAGYNGYVLRTTDAGATWEELPVAVYENINTVNVINEETVILSTYNKIVVSTDGGNEWTIRTIPGVTVVKTFFVNEQTGHAACTNGTMLKTVNGGIDWYVTAETNTSPSSYLSIHFITENIGFASREPSELFKTTDGGESWFALPDISHQIYAIFFINENMGYIAGEDGVMYKSYNGGNYWFWVGFQQGLIDYSTMNGIFFTDENHGFATGNRGRIIKTSNGGTSWEEYAPIYNDIKELQFVTDQKGYLLVGNDFHKTLDGGYTWEYQGSPEHYEYSNGFQFISENTGYSFGGGQSSIEGSVFKTVDGAKNWTKLNGGNQVILDAIYSGHFINEDTGIVSGGYNSPKIMRTTDGGNSWSKVGDLAFGQIQFVNDTMGFGRTTSYYGRIYKTTDAGKNWVMKFEIDEDVNSMDFVNENVGYITGDQGLMYKTEDGGKSWSELDIPYEYYISVNFYNALLGYIIDEDGNINKTENGGESWNKLTTIYGIHDIGILNSNVFLYGGYGKILKGQITGNTGTNDYDQHDPELLIFPNPAEKFIAFSSNSRAGIQSIEIYDLHGRLLVSQPGFDNKSASINIVHLRKGVHFFKILLEGNKLVTGKFMRI
jgi:photosystem II stability/assembly factor-like uncharacterized protein